MKQAHRPLHPTSMKPLGILGGGQLARMMVLKAHEMGLPVLVLSENPDDPAAQVTQGWVQGKLDDEKTLKTFLARCQRVTFESEFLDADRLATLSRATRTPIFPKPRHMALLQDRWTQKKLLLKHGLPTSPFVRVDDESSAQKAFNQFDGQLVFKKRRFGYDGYGTFVVRNAKDLASFLPELEHNPHGFIAEAFIPFQRELAIMAVRGQKGEVLTFPFVETYQENSRCLWVKGPLSAKQNRTLKQLQKRIQDFLKTMGYVGAMGIELFDTGREILVNELAPRVHNSGHYSLDALSEDQFSLHLKAVLGYELQAPQLIAPGFAMLNLLGSSARAPQWHLSPEVHLHWYGKNQNRAGRKMGHINTLGLTPEKALALALKHRSDFRV